MGPLAKGWDRSAHALPRRERCPSHSRSVDRFSDQSEGAILRRPDDHVEGLRDSDLELVDLDGAHVLPVGLDDAHLQAGDANIERRHRGGVDEA